MCQTYRIAICDDLATDRNYLSSLCEIWGSHNSYHIQISEFTSAENFLFHYAEKKDFDILLLDIEMGAMVLPWQGNCGRIIIPYKLYSSPDTQTIFLTDMK